MISLSKIKRLAESQRWGVLLESVLANGRGLPLGVRLRLGSGGSVMIAALGMALQRAVELSYLPTTVATGLARQISEAIAAIGQGENPEAPSAGALAIVLGAFEDLRNQAAASGVALDPEVIKAMHTAEESAMYRLFLAQEENRNNRSRPPREGLVGEPIDSALVLWQVGSRSKLRERAANVIRWSDLERAAERLDLWRDSDCSAVLALAESAAMTSHTVARPKAA